MKNNIKQKIFKAVESNRLKLVEGKRNWYNYIISIQELTILRNNKKGFFIDIFNKNEEFLERIRIEIKIVCEFGCIHNKLFLKN